jgi:hypothetical protein
MGNASGVLHIVPSSFVSRKFLPDEDEAVPVRSWKPVQIRSSPSPVSILSDWNSQTLFLQITNNSGAALSSFALAVNSNSYGLKVSQSAQFPEAVEPEQVFEVEIPYAFARDHIKPGGLAFALRTSVGIVYFEDSVDIRCLFVTCKMSRFDFLKEWSERKDSVDFEVNGVPADDALLEQRRICVVAQRPGEICVAFDICGDRLYIADLDVRSGRMRATVRGDPLLFPLIQDYARAAFCQE